MKLILHHFTLIPKHPFTISRGTRTYIPSLIVELQHNALSGFGEATANPYYNVTTEELGKLINSHIKQIESIDIETKPEEVWTILAPLFENNNFALCALDQAYHDLFTKTNTIRLYEYWKLNIHNNPMTSFTIGIDSIENMIAKIQEKPWPIYKIKLGTKNDIAIIKALRKHTNSPFIVDANASWEVEETLYNAVELKKLGVTAIEQPLEAGNWEGSKKVYENSVLPIIADESCVVESDVLKCVGHFHVVNIKLMKCGGLTPARRMIATAKELGIKNMAGCMTESSIGISAIAHLLPLLDFVDMDGALLLSNDPAKGVRINNGEVIYSENMGNGGELI